MPYRGVLWVMVGTLGVIGVGCLVGAKFIREAVQRVDLVVLYILSFALSLLLAFHDVMLYPWMNSLLTSTTVSSIHSFGLNLGFMTSLGLVLSLENPLDSRKLVELDFDFKIFGGVCVLTTIGISVLWNLGYGVQLRPVHEFGLLDFISRMQIEFGRSQLRSLVVLGVLQQLPFIAIEVLLPWKMMEKGIPLEIVVYIKILDLIPGVASGALVWHWVRKPQLMNLWIIAFVFRCCFGIGLLLVFANFSSGFTVLDHLVYLMIYAGLHGLYVFAKNLQLTSQGLLYQEIILTMDLEFSKMTIWWLKGFQDLGSHLPRFVVYVLSDVLSEWVCYRQDHRYSDVPCPKGKSLASTSNLCVDSGGECREVFDGFYPLTMASLVLSIPLGYIFYKTLSTHRGKLQKQD